MKFLIPLLSVFLFVATPVAHSLPTVNDSKIEKLKSEKITVGGKKVVAEIADTAEARERGLMYRNSMPENEGMLFVFDYPQPMAFWMKNTLIPLSIGYFDENRKLIKTFEMVPAIAGEARPKTYEVRENVLYALEMNKGWFEKHHIRLGAELKRPAKSPGK